MVGRRIWAQVVDGAPQFDQLLVVGLVLAWLAHPGSGEGVRVWGNVGALCLPPDVGPLEGLWNGGTIGKRLFDRPTDTSAVDAGPGRAARAPDRWRDGH